MINIGKTKLPDQSFKAIQENFTKEPAAKEKVEKNSAKALDTDVNLSTKAKIVEFLLTVKIEAKKNFETQSGVKQQTVSGGLDLVKLQYNGKPLTDLSPEEAQTLIAEDGYFGVTKTAERISGFVLSGANDNLDRLQAGREGVLKGFQDAEEAWGGKLPEISYQTIEKALEIIDARIKELGGSLIDVTA